MSGWVLIGVVPAKKKKKKQHACKVTSYLQFVKGLVGVWVLQLFELEKLERSPRHFQPPPPSVSVYLRIVLFTSDVILCCCTAGLWAGPWHCAFRILSRSFSLIREKLRDKIRNREPGNEATKVNGHAVG